MFFGKPGVKVMDSIIGISYYLNKCYKYAIKHITDNFFFQEDSAQVHCVCNNPTGWKCDFRVSPFSQVVQKHKLFEVAK